MTRRVPKSFCTTREAAELLGVSLKTVQLWSERGLLQAWRTEGGHRRILRDSLEQLTLGGSGLPARAARERGATRPRILVVEDNENMLRAYEQRLRRWRIGPEVRLASDAAAALLEAALWRPDLMITDLRMPDLDGFRMLRALRNRVEFQAMPIIVVTGLDAAELEARGGLPAGVKVFPKPIAFAELEAQVEAMTGAATTALSS